MADSSIEAYQANPEILSEAAIPFRFEVTWRSLTEPSEPARPEVALPVSRRAAAPAPEPREWEMILPRMKRPAPVPIAAPLTAEPPTEPAGTPTGRDYPALTAPVMAPQFGLPAEAQPMRRWAVLAAAGALALLFGGYQLMRHDSGAGPSGDGTEVGGAGWITEWASDGVGSARGRQLSLYRPSISMSDYNFEFFGRIERRSLGWVFRAADSSNYYAAKLEVSRPGRSQLEITRFAVIHGVEGPHIQRDLPFVIGPTEMLKVRLEARGPRFTIWVQNQVVEDWEDDQLKSGGLGFLNERQELGQIGSLQISFPKGGRRR